MAISVLMQEYHEWDYVMSNMRLGLQNVLFKGKGGVSKEVVHRGLIPAFLDEETKVIYLSRLQNGHIASIHVLDGLPDELVLKRDNEGAVLDVKSCLVFGFYNKGKFYTREQASELIKRIG